MSLYYYRMQLNPSTPIECLKLPLRQYHVLIANSIDTLDDLLSLSREEVLGLNGMGVIGYDQIVKTLHKNGYVLCSSNNHVAIERS